MKTQSQNLRCLCLWAAMYRKPEESYSPAESTQQHHNNKNKNVHANGVLHRNTVLKDKMFNM